MPDLAVCVRAAGHADLDPVLALLKAANLPTLGVAEHFADFLVAEDSGGSLLGAIGLEFYGGDTALLRSAVVHSACRGQGVGAALYERLLKKACTMGIRRLVLLTNTAEQYFARKGFRKIPRSAITGPVTQSIEFSDACPAHSAAMELLLSPK